MHRFGFEGVRLNLRIRLCRWDIWRKTPAGSYDFARIKETGFGKTCSSRVIEISRGMGACRLC